MSQPKTDVTQTYTRDERLKRQRRREEARFGFAPGTGCVAIFEFDRQDLENLLTLYPASDAFTADVREAMRWMDSDG